jgi:hypothetical protein
MTRANLTLPLALSFGLLIAGAQPVCGQAPMVNPDGPAPVPDGPRFQGPNPRPAELPAPAPASQDPGPPLLPRPGPVDGTLPAPTPVPESPDTQGVRVDPFVAGPGGFGPGGSPFFTPGVGFAPYRADYRATWFPSEPVPSQGTSLGYEQQDFSVSFPIWQIKGDEWTAGFHLRNEIFQTHAILPDTGQPFPDDLWNVHFTTTYRHLFDNGWIASGSVSVGSASDKPFHSIEEMTIGFHAGLRIPQGEHNAWLFSLSYSTTSQLPFPIPGVAFVWRPCPEFAANIGLPFMVMWRPTEELQFDVSYMLITNVHARASYRPFRFLRFFVGYDWNNESYLLADRPDVNDRFFYYDQRVTTGVQVFPWKNVSFELSGGYVFDRYYFEGQHYLNSQANRIDVNDGPFVSLQCQVRW